MDAPTAWEKFYAAWEKAFGTRFSVRDEPTEPEEQGASRAGVDGGEADGS